MSWTSIHVLDFGWVARLRIVQDGVAEPIDSYTTRQIIFRAPDGTETPKTAVFTTDGLDGYLDYTVEDGLIDAAGRWRVWASLKKTGAELTSDPVHFRVQARGN